jgi:hypothetical protein
MFLRKSYFVNRALFAASNLQLFKTNSCGAIRAACSSAFSFLIPYLKNAVTAS